MCFNSFKIKFDSFDYKLLYSTFKEKEINEVISRLQIHFAETAKTLDEKSNTHWVIRVYLAVKMILTSTIMLSSAKYGTLKNLRIAEAYLFYYSLLSCSRAVIFTSPSIKWSDDLMTMNHSKIINNVCSILSQYNKEKSCEFKSYIEVSKIYRELFSYRFPAGGLVDEDLNLQTVIRQCSLLAEIAQLQSAVLENAITKHIKGKYMLDKELLCKHYSFGEKEFRIIDINDAYNLNYIDRKQSRPYSIINSMTEGMVDDFFSAWSICDECNSDDIYNPDEDMRIIFPIP